MATPGGTAGFFSGLLGGVGEGMLTAQKQKHDEELKKNAALSQVYLKAVENGDLEPQHGIPLVANILSGSFSALTGDKKGSRKDKSMFTELLGDPEKLSGLLLGFHKATSSSPASGPAGPTGLATAGPTGVGGVVEGGQESPGSPLASRSGTMQAPARTSIFRTTADRQRDADTALTHSEDIKTAANVRQAGAVTQANYDAKLKVAQRMVTDGIAKDMPEALERVGLKEPKPPTPPKTPSEGSPAKIIQDAMDAFELANDRPPTKAERVQIAEKELKAIADGKRATKTSTVLDGLPAGAKERVADRLMSQGIEPSKATDEQVLSVMKEAGAAGIKKESLQNQAISVRIDNAGGGPVGKDSVTPDRPDPKTANVVDKATGLTPNTTYQAGLAWALQNAMPSLGLGSASQVRSARNAIINKGSAMAAAAGVDLPTLRAEYKGNATALNQLVPRYNVTAGAAGTANDNLQLALDQSAKVPRTGSPIANRFVQWANGQTLTGNPELTRFETYIYTAAREYAKVTGGGAGSVAALTDTAAKQASALLNAAQTPASFEAAVSAMQNDMGNVTANQAKRIAAVSRTVAQFLSGGEVPAGSEKSAPLRKPIPSIPGGEAESTDGGKTWKRVK